MKAVALTIETLALLNNEERKHVQKCNVLNCHTRDGGYMEERGNV